MSGLNLVLNIAKTALAAQQYGVDVASHNIANVDTDNYCRQSIPLSNSTPYTYGGVLMGAGVNVENVTRTCNQILEDRLASEKSGYYATEQSKEYMEVLEGYFNDDNDSNINALLSDFWNSWQDLSNNPLGDSERKIVYESADRLAERFNSLEEEMARIQTETSQEVESAVSKINILTKQIADLNVQIAKYEPIQPANDQRDKRNQLINDLSELINVKTIEQPNGNVTVTSAKGVLLVAGADSYDLDMDDDRVKWINSSGGKVDITDQITEGKIGGWLEMRDETLPKFQNDLNALAKEVIWAINYQHSQGAGLDYIEPSMTGTYAADSSGLLTTLPYGNKIDYTQDFKMWIQDSSKVPAEYSSITVDMGISDAEITNFSGQASGTAPSKYRFTVTQAGTVGPGTDDPKIKWEEVDNSGVVLNSGTVDITDAGSFTADGISFSVGEGSLVAGNTFTINTDESGNVAPLDMAVNKTGRSIQDVYKFEVVSGGEVGSDDIEISWSNSVTSGSFTIEGKNPPVKPVYLTVDGMNFSFKSGYLQDGDVFTIETDGEGIPTTHEPKDWQWTMESFRDEFNNKSFGVKAEITFDNKMRFIAKNEGFHLENFDYSTDVPANEPTLCFNDENIDISVENYTVGGLIADNIEFARTGANSWTVTNLPGATLTAIDGTDLDKGFYVNIDGERTFTVNFEKTIVNNGSFSFDIKPADGQYGFSFSDDGHTDPGLTAALGINTFYDGFNADTIKMNESLTDKDYIAASVIDGSSGELYRGDNSNAILISDLQFTSYTIRSWDFGRSSESLSTGITGTMDDFYEAFVGAMGIRDESITRSLEFNELMVKKLTEQRDNISSVNLDEEMVNMIKFQHAFSAASKLVKTADEMMNTLIGMK